MLEPSLMVNLSKGEPREVFLFVQTEGSNNMIPIGYDFSVLAVYCSDQPISTNDSTLKYSFGYYSGT